ncbi:MAG: YceI family protein [Bacteroidota bacterium]|nr:YceI family protein [Bacteroidota bacterium]
MSTNKWSLDTTHSELGFKIKHLMISNVSGGFTTFDVKTETSSDDFSDAKVVATVDVASINTNNSQRDNHLKNADFFDADTHPNLIFKSTKVEKLDRENFNLYGDLTIKDTTKPVKLAVEFNGIAKDPWGNIKAGFTVNGKINRKDFGITYNAVMETGGVMLGEEVKINADIQLAKQV